MKLWNIKKRISKFFFVSVLYVLWFANPICASQVSNSPNVNRIKLNALGEQITNVFNLLSEQLAIGFANACKKGFGAIEEDVLLTTTTIKKEKIDLNK